jgi:hypothetical protein
VGGSYCLEANNAHGGRLNMSKHPKFDSLKMQLTSTLDRLNQHGVIASVYDVELALARAKEAKVSESLRGFFGGLTLEELSVARAVLDSMQPKPVSIEPEETLTKTPASLEATKKSNRLGKR